MARKAIPTEVERKLYAESMGRCMNPECQAVYRVTKMVFLYVYCLSGADLKRMLPDENTIIVYLHNRNGESCISKQR